MGPNYWYILTRNLLALWLWMIFFWGWIPYKTREYVCQGFASWWMRRCSPRFLNLRCFRSLTHSLTSCTLLAWLCVQPSENFYLSCLGLTEISTHEPMAIIMIRPRSWCQNVVSLSFLSSGTYRSPLMYLPRTGFLLRSTYGVGFTVGSVRLCANRRVGGCHKPPWLWRFHSNHLLILTSSASKIPILAYVTNLVRMRKASRCGRLLMKPLISCAILSATKTPFSV